MSRRSPEVIQSSVRGPRPGIPQPDIGLPFKLDAVLQPIIDNINTYNGQGGWQQQTVSLGMLVELQIITEQQAKAIGRQG